MKDLGLEASPGFYYLSIYFFRVNTLYQKSDNYELTQVAIKCHAPSESLKVQQVMAALIFTGQKASSYFDMRLCKAISTCN